jgi:hypothetical protein
LALVIMRQRTLLDDTHCDGPTDSTASHNQATYEHVRRTLDEALAELQMPRNMQDDSGRITLRLPKL